MQMNKPAFMRLSEFCNCLFLLWKRGEIGIKRHRYGSECRRICLYSWAFLESLSLCQPDVGKVRPYVYWLVWKARLLGRLP